MSELFAPYRAITAEGARVALTTCRLCGATIMLDPQDALAPDALHERWHARTAGKAILELVQSIDAKEQADE